MTDSPLADDWVAHQDNPVLFDPLVARNGGLIVDRDDVYRVFQRQGFDMYGEACGVAKITTLTNTEYEEETRCILEPNFFNDIKGTHSYNFAAGLAVLDYVEISRKTK